MGIVFVYLGCFDFGFHLLISEKDEVLLSTHHAQSVMNVF